MGKEGGRGRGWEAGWGRGEEPGVWDGEVGWGRGELRERDGVAGYCVLVGIGTREIDGGVGGVGGCEREGCGGAGGLWIVENAEAGYGLDEGWRFVKVGGIKMMRCAACGCRCPEGLTGMVAKKGMDLAGFMGG